MTLCSLSTIKPYLICSIFLHIELHKLAMADQHGIST